jgi:peptidoglycan/LPS O-acetylase OafA/YrhL
VKPETPVGNQTASNSSYFQQIDILKAVAIVFVILGHTFSYNYDQHAGSIGMSLTGLSTIFHDISLSTIFTHWITYSSLITQQGVAVFVTVMAFNFALSYQRRSYKSLKDIYSKNEYLRRMRRFLIPFLSVYALSLLVGLLINVFMKTNVLKFSLYSIGGYLPIDGPGNYFIAIIFQFLLIFPILYIAYKKHPKMTLLVSFLVALAFEYAVSNLSLFDNATGLYSNLIIRFLPLLALSLWITDDFDLFAKRNRFIWILGILSIIYLITINQFQKEEYILGIKFVPFLESQNMFASFYEILLVLVGLKYIPLLSKKILNKLTGPLSYLGRASYHIFLIQIVYFGTVYVIGNSLRVNYDKLSNLVSVDNILICLLALSICLGIGIGLYFWGNIRKAPLLRSDVKGT